MRQDDAIRVSHMLDAAREALSFVQNRERSELDRNRLLALALAKSIEIVGEAASRVSEETRRQAPQIPWQDIVGMRNRLIHVYYDIDLDRLWDTLNSDLPPLITQLKGLLDP